MKQFPTHIVTVMGIVENDNGEILLLKNRGNGAWTFAGGIVENGEDLITALKREAMEECNMDIAVGKLFRVASNTGTYQGYDGYDVIPTKVLFSFICKYISGEFVENEEKTEHCWVHRDKVLELLTLLTTKHEYNYYLTFTGNIHYFAYTSRPDYEINAEGLF